MARTPRRLSSRTAFFEAIQGLAVGIAETAGFAVATVSVAFSDTMETIAVAGPDDVRRQLRGHSTPLEDVEKEISNADDAAHPRLVPIRDDDGRLRSVVTLDQPLDGRPPSADDLAPVRHYLTMVRRTVLYAIERVELDEQIQMSEAVRQVIREASSDLTIGGILDYAQTALTTTFDASGLWLQTFDEDGDGLGAVYASSGADIFLKDHLREVARPAARMLWELQSVAVIDESMPRTEAMTAAEEQQVFDFMRTINVSSMLFVPLGVGKECLGNLVLTREPGNTIWTDLEKRTALDIGHDLGRALLNARSFERERRIVDELRELDSYKSRLIATLAHELKNPLTSILGHAEMLEATPDLPHSARTSVAAVERGAARMQRLVENLLALGQAADPSVEFTCEPVDLRQVVDDVTDMLRVTAERKALDLTVDGPPSLVVQGDPAGLDQVIGNLVSNAAKYTPDSGSVTVRLASSDGVATVEVTDTGMGISEDDQKQLFEEFFRSTNPAAVALPGTGLGLAIARRIIERHNGTITFTSALGSGTSFVVSVPATLA